MRADIAKFTRIQRNYQLGQTLTNYRAQRVGRYLRNKSPSYSKFNFTNCQSTFIRLSPFSKSQ